VKKIAIAVYVHGYETQNLVLAYEYTFVFGVSLVICLKFEVLPNSTPAVLFFYLTGRGGVALDMLAVLANLKLTPSHFRLEPNYCESLAWQARPISERYWDWWQCCQVGNVGLSYQRHKIIVF
jgi:hypothetical protein